MKKQTVLLFALFLLAPLAAYAQSGCGDSPENPTAVLALLGSGTAAITALRQRYRRRRK